MNPILLILTGLSILIVSRAIREHTKKRTKSLMSNIRFETFKGLEQKFRGHAQLH